MAVSKSVRFFQLSHTPLNHLVTNTTKVQPRNAVCQEMIITNHSANYLILKHPFHGVMVAKVYFVASPTHLKTFNHPSFANKVKAIAAGKNII